jgi:predicted house-cleaning noncanonical NTP pyrophosphatase (MazG superfamily)
LFFVDEKTKPFTFIFQKEARKRHTDLFLESWKKVTTKTGQSCQFKCSARQEFFNLFMDAFQNCIEETANSKMNDSAAMDQHNGSMNSSQSTAVNDFKVKMNEAFEKNKMFPVRKEDYEEFLNKADKEQAKEESQDASLKQNNNLINVIESKLDSEQNQLNKVRNRIVYLTVICD